MKRIMPQTFTSWIVFATIMVSGCASIATAVKLILSAHGKATQDRRDFHAACLFGVLLVVATALFLWIEPTPT